MRSLLVASLLALLLVGTVRAEETTEPNASAHGLLATVRRRLESLKSYTMETVVAYRDNGSTVHSRMSWLSPRFFQIASRFNADTSARTVFDGTWQWIERSQGPGPATVVKIRLDRLNPPGQPIGAFYFKPELGLDEEAEYRESLLNTLHAYHFRIGRTETVNGAACTVLEGSLDDETLISLDRNLARAPERDRPRLLDLVRRCRLWITADGLVARASMGSTAQLRDDTATVVDYRNIVVDPPLTPQMFRFEPPAGVTATDVTDRVIEERERWAR